MSTTRWLAPCLAVLAFVLNDCGTVNNGTDDLTCGTSTLNIPGGTFDSFGTTADGRRVDAFLQATIDLHHTVTTIYQSLLTTCTTIGTSIGLTSEQLAPTATVTDPVAAACGAVTAEIKTIIQNALPSNQTLQLVYTPPVCQVDLSVAAMCAASCTGEASVAVPQCMGDIVADCAGTCSGSCDGSCAGGCTGSCTGTCSGTCTGTCFGTCSGTCDVMDQMGRCAGNCTGSCTGSCMGGCTGSCMGSCSAGCMGECSGQCRGMCSVATNVTCDGQPEIQVDAQCQAACQAQAEATATCTPPVLTIGLTSSVSPQSIQALNNLISTLQTNYPLILADAEELNTLIAQSAPAFVSSLQGLSTVAEDVGLTAAACIVRAGADAVTLASEVNVSVTVTVNFSAAVSAPGNP